MIKIEHTLLKSERLNYILKQVNVHNKVLSSDLCESLSVSEDTIRRDLMELADGGQILKVHGGALSKKFYGDDNEENVYAHAEKVIIAQKTVQLLKEGMFVLIGGGTTMKEILKLVPKDLAITFITVSLSAATELLNHPSCGIIFVGGQISRNTRFSVGGETIARLAEIKADLCILGTNSIDFETGITDSDFESVQVKKAMMKAADKVAIVTIAEKLSTTQRLRICEIKDLDYLITELEPDNTLLNDYRPSVKIL